MSEACARCAIILLQEPLIPDCDVEEYGKIVHLALHGLQEAKKQPQFAPVYSAYASGIFYSSARFCPQILVQMFSDVITEEKVEDFHNRFLEDLKALQRRPFYRN